MTRQGGTVNQYKERIKRIRDNYNAEFGASYSFMTIQSTLPTHLPLPPDDDEHVRACAHIIADAYRNGDYAHMWEYLQLFENFDAGEADIEEHIPSVPGQEPSRPALLARVRLRAQAGI